MNGGDIGYFLDTVSRGATEVREEFYDTLLFLIEVNSASSLLPDWRDS
jgi:hypothetical protein